LELVPGKGLGEFLLGMPISDAISVIQQNIDFISMVELKFSEQEPLAMDIVLDLVEDGFLLRFEPTSQRLKMIEIYDVPKVTLSYCGSVFSAADVPPTFVLIYSRFGPSYPGDYNSTKNVYRLHYPNLSFTFPIPTKFQSFYSNGTELPVEFPDGTTPITTRIYIYSGSSVQSPLLPLQHSSSLYFEPVIVDLQPGSLFFSKRGTTLTFNSSTQDLISELGPPTRVYYKEEDKMRIHSNASNTTGYPDYFYNYFSVGIDFLIDAHTHKVKKFILHTNFPTHYEFNQYVKCNFRIQLPGDATGEEYILKNKENKQGERDANDNTKKNILVEPDMKWEVVQTLFGKSGKPVVNNRGSSANPFGATFFYGYHGIIFEVMRNNHISSVCIFNNE